MSRNAFTIISDIRCILNSKYGEKKSFSMSWNSFSFGSFILQNILRNMSSHGSEMPVNFVKTIRLFRILKKSVNLYDLIRPMYVISRIFGMLPFRILRSSAGDSIVGQCVGPIDLIWFFVTIGIHFYLAFSSIQNIAADQHWQTKSLFSIGDNFIVLYDITIAILTIILDMINRHRFINILKKFIEFDKKVKSDHFFRNHITVSHQLIKTNIANHTNRFKHLACSSVMKNPRSFR